MDKNENVTTAKAEGSTEATASQEATEHRLSQVAGIVLIVGAVLLMAPSILNGLSASNDTIASVLSFVNYASYVVVAAGLIVATMVQLYRYGQSRQAGVKNARDLLMGLADIALLVFFVMFLVVYTAISSGAGASSMVVLLVILDYLLFPIAGILFIIASLIRRNGGKFDGLVLAAGICSLVYPFVDFAVAQSVLTGVFEYASLVLYGAIFVLIGVRFLISRKATAPAD